uniref:Brain protein I3 n=1 Tax=Mesocestoides corti TaxID=53468 RepID=A0A5K3FKN1_MESCO
MVTCVPTEEMYNSKDHQSYEMDQQGLSSQGQAVEVAEEVEGAQSDGNGVRGSLGSLGGPRIAGGDVMYDGHGSLSAIPVSTLTAAQAAAVHQQQAIAAAAAANYRYMTLPSHPQVIPATEYVYTSGGPVGNHIVGGQSFVAASHAQPLMYTTTAAAPTNQHQQIQQPYDRCPAICSLFAIFCCPITCWCSLPALAYSLCAYTDYRANDMHSYRSKSDVARRCVIIACIVGLILCIIWAILTFLYYGEMLLLLGDVIKAVQRHIWPGN